MTIGISKKPVNAPDNVQFNLDCNTPLDNEACQSILDYVYIFVMNIRCTETSMLRVSVDKKGQTTADKLPVLCHFVAKTWPPR
jgi:hypothetical protein